MKLVRRDKTGEFNSTNCCSLVNRVLAQRGITDESQISFELQHLLPVSRLRSIDKATQILAEAFDKQQNILIIGDFDADGATSTAVAIKALTVMGFEGKLDYLIPNRFEYGYGLTPEIVDAAQEFQPELIITVDNGISSVKGVARAKALGCKVIITDHHLPAKDLPAADAIINPNQPGCDFPSKNLAGVGVIFYLMLALKNHLQQQTYFERRKQTPPNMVELLDLVALGTVADVVTLDQNNRILVEQGLRRMRAGKACAGLQALFHIANKNIRNAVSTDLGFACGPRLNAAGRLDDMSIGIECLLSNDYQQALQLAETLDDLNQERRTIEESMKVEAIKLLEDLDEIGENEALPPVICLYKESWHQGVIGILAARVRERYHRPSIIFAPADNADEIKGSARSIPGIHIRDMLDEVASSHPDLLQKFGGHAMAAGLSLHPADLSEFQRVLADVLHQHIHADTFQEVVYTDGQLEAEDFALERADEIRYAAPWGQNFPPPLFDNHFTLLRKTILKDKHLRLLLRPERQSRSVAAIAFNTEIEQWPEEGDSVHLLYRLEINEFRETFSLQLLIERLL